MEIEENDQNIENEVNDFNSGESEIEDIGIDNNVDLEDELPINIYNSSIYNFAFIYNYFITNNILYPGFHCLVCHALIQ